MTNQAFELPAGAFDVLGQHREIECQTQVTGAQRPSFLLDAGQVADWAPGSVDAFDDAEVALDAVGESDQRLLVGLTLVCREGLFKAVELDQDSALGDSSVVCDDPTATDEEPPAHGLDGRTGQLVVGSQLLRV